MPRLATLLPWYFWVLAATDHMIKVWFRGLLVVFLTVFHTFISYFLLPSDIQYSAYASGVKGVQLPSIFGLLPWQTIFLHSIVGLSM